VDRPPRERPLNADPSAQLLLLDLQACDTRRAQLAHRRRTLPEAQALAELDARITRTADEVVAAETIALDLAREQAKAEADVEQVRERSARDRNLLDSGSIGDPKQLQSLQHELESLARRQSDLEDIELEVMERAEGADAAVVELRSRAAGLAQERTTLAGEVENLLADISTQDAQAASERDALAARLPADLLALYDRIRTDHGGVGAAPLHRRRCEGCHLELTAQDIETLRATAAEEVVRCEECRRILVRTAESGL
jgi:predicted  nucleic acid-binding Zn-ribbon protein